MTRSRSFKASTEQFGDATTGAPVATFLIDSARTITATNTAAEKLTGYKIDALAGLSLQTLFAARDDWASTDAMLAAATDQTAQNRMQFTMRTRDAALIDVSMLITPLSNGSGAGAGAIAVIAPCGAAAQSSKGQANEESAMIRFARGAAHDFKNLLAIITGNVQLAANEPSPKPRAAFLADAERACAMAARLANQMIAFARDRAAEPVSLSIQAIFDEQAAILQRASGPGITLTFDVNPNIATVRADRSGLEAAVLNLIVNARDAMPGGGTITVSAENVTRNRSAFVSISVRDTGTGMTGRVRARAFDPFFSTKPLSHGTGLGLATVMGFVRQSGGHAEIASKIGEGTTVTIALPAEVNR